jgi:hypothetical protein
MEQVGASVSHYCAQWLRVWSELFYRRISVRVSHTITVSGVVAIIFDGTNLYREQL